MRLLLLPRCIPSSPGQGVSSPNHQQGEAGQSLLIGRLWPLQRKRERVTHSRARGDEGACSTPILLPGGRKTHAHTHTSTSTKPTSLCSPCFKACSSHPAAYLEHSLPLITALLCACAKSLQLSLTLQPTKLLWPLGFSRQEFWSGLPFPSPGDLPNPGFKPGSPSLQADALPSEPQKGN